MKAYDSRCEDLARVFLPETTNPDDVEELAQLIQDTIENFMAGTEPGESTQS